MASFEDYISAGVRDGILPGAVLYATDKSGNFNYSKVFSPESSSHVPPVKPSTKLWLASATKLITTIAVLQLVEHGSVTLDEDVSRHIPALAAQQVLTGFSSSDKEAEPVLEPRRNPITLRALLTHSAGTAYDFLSPSIQHWQALHDISPVSGADVEARYSYPLVYQPGEDWAYSNSIDWAGRALESITGTGIEAYLEHNVFEPLGLTSFTFATPPAEGEGALWPLSGRDPTTGKVIPYTGLHLHTGVASPLGGQGLYGRMDEYLLILRSLLVDDGRLLRPATAAAMFRPQLGGAAKQAFLRAMEDPSWAVGDYPPTGEYDWGLGGLVIDGDAHAQRRRGTLIWAGAGNIFWWIDRETGLAGVFGTQIMPPGEAVTEEYIKAYEKEMYARVEALKSDDE